jgi:hypothetical protein
VKSTSSEPRRAREQRWYSCDEPWIGIFSVETNLDVTFCPCYAKVRIGNLGEASMHEIWNSPALVGLRETFRQGELPDVCAGQLCPVVLGEE